MATKIHLQRYVLKVEDVDSNERGTAVYFKLFIRPSVTSDVLIPTLVEEGDATMMMIPEEFENFAKVLGAEIQKGEG